MSAESSRPARFAAVIAHADDPELLERCIAHHLAIGVDRIFVSLNREDAASACVAQSSAADPRVRFAPVASFAPDAFHYFTAALGVVMRWAAPEWILFVDSDEFWIPASGDIHDTAGLAELDVLAVPRFNAPPIRDADGNLRPYREAPNATTLVVDAAELIGPDNVGSGSAKSWIMSRDHPKVLVRPQLVSEVGRGAHSVTAAGATLRGTTAQDLLIVHLPFTTRERFHRKIDAIRARLAVFGHRFGPGQAWHWRRWIELADAGKIDAEFDDQVIDAAELEALRSDGVLVTPEEMFARRRAACD